MRIPINLASQPFRRDRAMLLATTAVAAALSLTLGGLVYLYSLDRAQSAELRGEVARLDRGIAAAVAQQAQLDALLRQPENATAVELSVFINTLLVHKGISWSRLFADLEDTIPYNVKLVSLVPSINSQNKVVLEITVAADKAEALPQFARSLENSPVFRDVVPHTTQPPTQADPFFLGRVTVSYVQKL